MKKQKKYRSFSRRLTWRIILALTLVLGLLNAILFMFCSNIMTRTFKESFIYWMVTENKTLEKELYGIEVASHNSIDEIEAHIGSPESVKAALADELRANSRIKGFFVAFEPDYFPKKGRWYEPYVVWRDNNIEVLEIGSQSHDYLEAEWYKEGLRTDSGYWSNSYRDNDGAKEIVCTYAMPLHDKQGRKIGVFGADVSIERILKKMHDFEIKTFKDRFRQELDQQNEAHFFSFIISDDGTYLAHPDKKRILNGNFFEVLDSATTMQDESAAMKAAIIHGEEGINEGFFDGYKRCVFHIPLKHTGWTLCFVVSWVFIQTYTWIFAFILGLVMLMGLAAVYIISWFTIHRSTKPLHKLADSADEVAQGNFTASLPDIRQNDEVHRLRDSFANMQHSLVKYIDDLKKTTAEKASIESELNIARDIQMAMLPSPDTPHPATIGIDASLTPAKAVGGDLYDYFMSGSFLYFCIGDVSGKGVPAALLMTVARSLFRSYSTNDDDPATIVAKMNKSMSENNEACMFVTLFMGILDTTTGLLRYCSAGHEQPLLIGDDVSRLPIIPNMAIGMMDDTKYVTQDTVMPPHSTLFLFTDGLNEAMDAEGRQLGRKAVADVARQAIANGLTDPRQLTEMMRQAVAHFVNGAEQSDDLTMLAIRRNANAISIKPTVDEMDRLKDYILGIAGEAHLDKHETKRLRLAVEEAVINVIDHNDATQITITHTTSPLTITITDNGSPFDPTAAPDIDVNQPGEERQIGGLGIFYIRQMSKSLEYRRDDNKNILVITM